MGGAAGLFWAGRRFGEVVGGLSGWGQEGGRGSVENIVPAEHIDFEK